MSAINNILFNPAVMEAAVESGLSGSYYTILSKMTLDEIKSLPDSWHKSKMYLGISPCDKFFIKTTIECGQFCKDPRILLSETTLKQIAEIALHPGSFSYDRWLCDTYKGESVYQTVSYDDGKYYISLLIPATNTHIKVVRDNISGDYDYIYPVIRNDEIFIHHYGKLIPLQDLPYTEESLI
jgi:hypothetical protein